MTLLLPHRRPLLGVSFCRNELWRRARAVPSLDLRFADNKSLVDAISGQNLITFSRTSGATVTDSTGTLITVPSDTPRFDHNPTTGESLGLLVEEARTNLLVQSEDFATTWTVFRASVSTNAIAAPTGNLTADKIVEDTTATNTHGTQQANISFTSGISYALSVYVKAAERVNIRLTLPAAAFTTALAAQFNLVLGTTTVVSGGATATISSLQNGWYRCTIAAAATATATSAVAFQLGEASTSTTVNYTGDGTSGLFIWGAQLEVGAFPTSYIPTTTAAATRSADVASISGSNFSSWYRQDEGTVFADAFREFAVPATAFPVIFDARVQPTDLVKMGYLTEDLTSLNITNNTVTQSELYPAGFVNARRRKLASAYALNNFAICGNGNAPVVDSVGTPPSNIASVSMGSTIGIGQYLNGTIHRLTYWPTRLGNEVLQRITQQPS